MTRTSLPDLGGRRFGLDRRQFEYAIYIFLKEENQGKEDLVKIGYCQNRKNNLSKLTGNMSRVNSGPAVLLNGSQITKVQLSHPSIITDV